MWHYYPQQQQILVNQWTWGSSAGDGVCTVILQNTVVLEEACMLRGPAEWYSTCLASARLPGFDTAQHEIIMMTMTVITQTSVSAKLIQNTVWNTQRSIYQSRSNAQKFQEVQWSLRDGLSRLPGDGSATCSDMHIMVLLGLLRKQRWRYTDNLKLCRLCVCDKGVYYRKDGRIFGPCYSYVLRFVLQRVCQDGWMPNDGLKQKQLVLRSVSRKMTFLAKIN